MLYIFDIIRYFIKFDYNKSNIRFNLRFNIHSASCYKEISTPDCIVIQIVCYSK